MGKQKRGGGAWPGGREAEAASGQVAPLSSLSSEPPRKKRGRAGGSREKGWWWWCGCGSRREVGLSGQEEVGKSVKKQRRDPVTHQRSRARPPARNLRSQSGARLLFSSPSRNFSTSRLSRSATPFTRRLLARCSLCPSGIPLSGRKGRLALSPEPGRGWVSRPCSPPGLCAKSLGEAPLPALGTPPPRPDYL